MNFKTNPLKTYTKFNFHKHTFCIFTEVDFSYISNLEYHFKSKSGSEYYFTDKGVYRKSNHWSRVANCKWRLVNNNLNKNNTREKLGYANWTDFHSDNEFEKIYFLEVNFEKNEVYFQHKNNCKTLETIFKTAPEVSKLIKQVRNLLETDSWAKHFNQEISFLRKQIINKLLSSNASLQEIKRNFL